MLKPLKVSVVVPALNEQNNVRDAIRSILEGFAYYQYDGEIIVVDDNSPDGTYLHCKTEFEKNNQIKETNSRVHYINSSPINLKRGKRFLRWQRWFLLHLLVNKI